MICEEKKKSLSKNGFTEGYRNKDKRERREIDRKRNLLVIEVEPKQTF